MNVCVYHLLIVRYSVDPPGPGLLWLLVSHMVSVRPTEKQKHDKTLKQNKTCDNAIMGPGGSLNSQNLLQFVTEVS